MRQLARGWKKDPVGENVGTAADVLGAIADGGEALGQAPEVVGDLGRLARLGSAYSGGSRLMHNLTSREEPGDKTQRTLRWVDQVSAGNDLIGIHPASKPLTAPVGLALQFVEQGIEGGISAQEGRPLRAAGQIAAAGITGVAGTVAIGATAVLFGVGVAASAPFWLTAGAIGAAGVGLYTATTMLTDRAQNSNRRIGGDS